MRRLRLIAALSGAWGLALELLWVRALVLQTGGPLAAFTVVLTAVMAGMAVGSLLGGRQAARSRAPLLILGAAQIAIAAAAAASSALGGTGGVTRAVLLASGAEPGSMLWLSLAGLIAGLAAFVPSLGLGAVLPILSAAAPPPAALAAGPLAAASALGGAAGAILCGFVLLPAAGLAGSFGITAAAAACTGLLCLPRLSPAPRHAGAINPGATVTSARAAASLPGAARPAGAMIVLAVAGMVLTGLQIVWARMASLCFGSSIQAGSLVLASVIIGLAAGNALGGRLARRATAPRTPLAIAAWLAALSLALSDPVLARLPLLVARMEIWLAAWHAGPGAALVAKLILCGGLVAIPAGLCGTIFPLGIAALRQGAEAGARPVARGAGSSAIGNLLGGPAAFAALALGAGSRGVLLAAAALLGAASAAGAPRPRRVLAGGTVAAALLIVMALPGTGGWLRWDPAIMSSGPYMYASLYGAAMRSGGTVEEALRERGNVILAREGAQALATVRALPTGVLSLQVNGKTDASTGGDMKVQLLMPHLPLILMEASGRSARDVLVVGLGSGVSLAGALAHPIQSATVVELLREVVQVSAAFDAANRGARDDPRARLVIGDARARLLFEARDYDAIISQPSNPWIAGQAVLFTQEYFDLARRRLRPGGVMCQWLQSYGMMPEDFRSVVATFASVFPEVTLWEESVTGGDYLLLGSDTPLQIDAQQLAAAAGRPLVRDDLARIEVDGAAGLLAEYVTGGEALRAWLGGSPVEIQVEDRLALEFTAPAALRHETPGLVLAGLEPARRDPASLLRAGAAPDPALMAQLGRLRREGARERRWAAGLGLLAPQRPPNPRLLLAYSYLRAGMRRQAISIMRAMRAEDDTDKLPRLLLAHLAMSEGNKVEAIRELQAAADLDRADPGVRLFLSRARWAAGDLAGALAANDAALALDPGRAEAHSDRCGLLLASGDLPGADAACREAIARDPRLAEARANLGLVLARQWQVEEALASYRRALELDPDLVDARFNLAALLERVGKSAEALEALSPALEPQAAADAATLRLGARIALSAGRVPEAAAWLQQSLVLEPSSAEASLLRAAIESRGKPGSAPATRFAEEE